MKFFISITTLVVILFVAAFAAAGAAENPEYRLQPTDVITITVHGQPDLTTKTRITSDGYITFPLLGKISIQDLTVQELESKLKALLEKDYLVSAQVLVFIEQYHSKQVSVMGEVNTPGKYDMPGEKDMTLMQAVAMAGGFSKHADITKVKVMRMESGDKKNIVVNAKDITQRGDQDKDIVLKPDDIVFVPESFF